MYLVVEHFWIDGPINSYILAINQMYLLSEKTELTTIHAKLYRNLPNIFCENTDWNKLTSLPM